MLTNDVTVATDNPSVESWMKACTPFTAPMNLEKPINDGKVTFRGIKVAAVDSADGGASSLASLRLAMSAADLKTRYPELSQKIKLPKSKHIRWGWNARWQINHSPARPVQRLAAIV